MPATPTIALVSALLTPAGTLGAAKTITGAAAADGVTTITASTHGFSTGDLVVNEDIGGATEANGIFVATRVDANSFTIPVAAVTAYTSGGTAKKITATAGFVRDLKPYQVEQVVGALNRKPWSRVSGNNITAEPTLKTIFPSTGAF
jgi:hypothetical protein